MTDKELLKKVLEKAELNGYESPITTDDNYWFGKYMTIEDLEISGGDYDAYEHFSIRDIIFNHDFAKAFWGEAFIKEDKEVYGETCDLYFYRWQLHLTSLVLEKEPLKYLEKFLKGSVD